MTKEKEYAITVDSTKNSLDHLKRNYNSEISDNALTIIASLKNIHYMPVWAQKEFVEYIHNDEKARISNSLGSKKNQYEFEL